MYLQQRLQRGSDPPQAARGGAPSNRACPPAWRLQRIAVQQQERLAQALLWPAVSGRPARHTAARFSFDQAWGPSANAASQSIAPQLFAASLFPYLAFLYYLTRSGQTPRLVLVGFYFLLAFVGATIPAGIYAKVHYGTSLANVDWLHGTAESLLTVTNLLVVLGLRNAIKEAEAANAARTQLGQQLETVDETVNGASPSEGEGPAVAAEAEQVKVTSGTSE